MRAVLRRNQSPASASRRLVRVRRHGAPRDQAQRVIRGDAHRPSRSRAGDGGRGERPADDDGHGAEHHEAARDGDQAPLPRPGRAPPAAGPPRPRTAGRRAARPARRPGRGQRRPARRARPPRGAHGPTRPARSRPGHRRCAGRPGRGPGWRPRWRHRRRAPPRRAPRRPARPAAASRSARVGPSLAKASACAPAVSRDSTCSPWSARSRRRACSRPGSSAASHTSYDVWAGDPGRAGLERGEVDEHALGAGARDLRQPARRSGTRRRRAEVLGQDVAARPARVAGSGGQVAGPAERRGRPGRSLRWAATGTPNEVPLTRSVGPVSTKASVNASAPPGQRLPGCRASSLSRSTAASAPAIPARTWRTSSSTRASTKSPNVRLAATRSRWQPCVQSMAAR